MLNNWTVITQPVKNGSSGIVVRERYLLSRSHTNHQNTETLTSLVGNEQTSQRIALLGEQLKLKQQLQRKGGRPLSSYAMEFCLTLPKPYRPSIKEWKLIVGECCKDLAHFCQLNNDEIKLFKTCIRAVLHQQKQTQRKGSGDHVHLIVPKVIGGRVLKELQQKKGTRLLKQSFNTAVLKHVGLDYKEYKPYDLARGQRMRSWKYQQQKADEALYTEELIAKLQKQTEKWFEAQRVKDLRQSKRQRNRLNKTLEEISKVGIPQRYKRDISRLNYQINSTPRPAN